MKKQIKIIISISLIVVMLFGAAFALKYAYNRYVYGTYPLKYQDEVKAASEKYNIDEALIYGVIKTESNFNPDAVSHAGAIGLMQITPETFEWIQTYYKDDDYTVDDLQNYRVNIDYGTHILSILMDMYGCEDTAICAYNAGIGRVDGWLEDKQYSDDGKTLKALPIEETENYRHKVQQNKNAYIKLYFQDENSKNSDK
ncbi:MAG: lytic transglycosylase domain-containing protein [Acutalibacteraceae bacterium]